MPLRAIRGATTVATNSRQEILSASRELLSEIAQTNRLAVADIVSAFFTLTPDLDAAFPARAARDLGWTSTALLDAQAPRVANDLPRCIRVLIHCETSRAAHELRHVYLRDAAQLRPDWAAEKTE
jgi:chorismate mutase